MFTFSKHSTQPAIPVTATVVDLRNFTPHLIAAQDDAHGTIGFYDFLTRFYGLCLESCLVALPPSLRTQPPLYMSSTGDGVLIVFFDRLHFEQAYLAGLIMHIQLRRYCEQYNKSLKDPNIPRTSFGMGIESGTARRIHARGENPSMSPIVDTFIGNCINIAARAEAVSKGLYRANSIVGPQLLELVARAVQQQSYEELELKAKDQTLADTERFRIYGQMDELNRSLFVTYIHHHLLKGIEKPIPLFRLSDRFVTTENLRFMELLKKLVHGSEAHCAEIISFVSAIPSGEKGL